MPHDTLTDAIPTDEIPTTRPDTPQRVFAALRWTIVGFGVGCLLAAAVIGGYTLFGATRLPDCRATACATTSDLAMRLAWAVLAVALVVLVALAVQPWLSASVRARGRWELLVLAAGGGLGIVIGYRTSQFAEARNSIDTHFRTWEQMWTITPAVWLLALGAAAVAIVIGLRKPGLFGAAGFALGLVIAVVVGATTGAAAAHRGDDGQYVDATTAQDRGVAPKPAELGLRRFQLALPTLREATVLPAGAGFVVKKAYGDASDVPDVVAYDEAGRERWHYRRTGPGDMSVTGVGVYGDGSVVVLSVFGERGLYIGLDAVTGAHLWTSTDAAIGKAVDVDRYAYRSPQFVIRDEDRWIAFDPRTGQRVWSIADPVRCPKGTPAEGRLPHLRDQKVYPIDTTTTVGVVLDCSTPDRVDLRLVTVDPASGAVTTDTTLTALEGVAREDIQSWVADPVPGAQAVIVRLFSRTQPMDAYVDYQTGLRTDYPGPNPLAAIGDGMFTLRDGQTLRIFSGEAVPQCDIPLGADGDVDYAFLRDQVVVLDEKRPGLRVFDRAGCGQVRSVPVPAGFTDIQPMRGVTLLTRRAGTEGDVSTTLLGFAPS